MFCNMVSWSVGRWLLLIFVSSMRCFQSVIGYAGRENDGFIFHNNDAFKNWSIFTEFLWKYLSICTKLAGDGVKEEVKKQRKSK